MKFFYTAFFYLITFDTLTAQYGMWQFDFNVHDVNVRTDTAYQLYVSTINLPASGHVIAKIEGECQVSKGDAILLAASRYKNWSPNFGNVGTISYDSIYTHHAFRHTMVYKVEKGQQSFYALAHNWTDKGGSGRISATGRMILEYIPDVDTTQTVFYNQLNVYPLVLNETEQTINTLSVLLEKPGYVNLAFDGRIYSTPKDELSIRILSPDRGVLHETTSFHAAHSKLNQVSMNALIFLPAGQHELFLTAMKNKGNMETSNNAFYGTFYAAIVPDAPEEIFNDVKPFNAHITSYQVINELQKSTWDIPADGKVLVSMTGHAQIKMHDQWQINALIGQTHWEETMSTYCNTTLEAEEYAYFSRQQLFPVKKGKMNVQIDAIMTGNGSTSFPAAIKGELKINFIADPVISALSEPVKSEKTSFLVFPNPVTDWINVFSPIDNQTPDYISLRNSTGVILQECTNPDYHFPLPDIPAGMYILTIRKGSHVEHHTIIKSK